MIHLAKFRARTTLARLVRTTLLSSFRTTHNDYPSTVIDIPHNNAFSW